MFKHCAVDIMRILGEDRVEAVSQMKPEAQQSLQTAAEVFVSNVLQDAGEATLHSKHKTLLLADLYLAIRMRGYDLSILQNSRASE